MSVRETPAGAAPEDRLLELRESLGRALADLEDLGDAAQRVQALTAAVGLLEEYGERLSEVRLGAVADLRQRGWSYQRIAIRTGLSKSRIAQLSRAVGDREVVD